MQDNNRSTLVFATSVDLDQMVHKAPYDQGPHSSLLIYKYILIYIS